MVASRKKVFAHYLAIWGCISTAIVYTAIGAIAILSFMKLKQGGADESSLLVYLDTFIVGTILVWLILSGMISFIIWRIYETIHDPYEYGSSFTGISRRAIIALSSLADGLIAYSAIQALLGIGGANKSGHPTAQRELTSDILSMQWGAPAIITIGIIVLLIAIMQMGYVISNAYKERLHLDRARKWKQAIIHFLAWAGHFARGTILGIVGFFYAKAGFTRNENYVVNTDKAFDFIGDHVGHFYFILIAAGTICYGLFMFTQAVYYNFDKD